MTDHRSVSTRRGVLAALATVPFAGCTAATYSADPGNQSEDDGEQSDMDAFVAELEAAGITVDSYMTLGGTSIMYMRDPDAPHEQLETIADRFIYHHDVVDEGSILSLTALESKDSRHGVTGIPREWAEQVANGEMAMNEYVQKVIDDYMTV